MQVEYLNKNQQPGLSINGRLIENGLNRNEPSYHRLTKGLVAVKKKLKRWRIEIPANKKGIS